MVPVRTHFRYPDHSPAGFDGTLKFYLSLLILHVEYCLDCEGWMDVSILAMKLRKIVTPNSYSSPRSITNAILQWDGLASLLQEDEFALLILDACRWDTIRHFLGAEVRRAISPSVLTVRWLSACWPSENDITYVTGIPHIAPTPRDTNVNYDGTNHFQEVVYLGDDAWDADLKTVPPAPIRDAAIEADADRVIVHFLQPHMPFIGETRFEELAYSQLGPPDVEAAPNEILDEVPNDTVRKAYFDNLQRVWNEGVEPLLKAFDDRHVVITADHGEMLGENGYYGHGRIRAPVVVVPWVDTSPEHSTKIPWAEDPIMLSQVIADYIS